MSLELSGIGVITSSERFDWERYDCQYHLIGLIVLQKLSSKEDYGDLV